MRSIHSVGRRRGWTQSGNLAFSKPSLILSASAGFANGRRATWSEQLYFALSTFNSAQTRLASSTSPRCPSAGHQQAAGEVSFRHQADALAERSHCRLVFASCEVGGALDVQVVVGKGRIEAQSPLDSRQGCLWISYVRFGARSIASKKTVSSVVSLARVNRRMAATVEQSDRDLWLLNTPSGVVDLRSGKQRPHDPCDYLTKVTAVTHNPSCSISLWLSFLERVLQG